MTEEVVVRFVDLSVDRRNSILIFSGLPTEEADFGPDGQIRPDWVAITHARLAENCESWNLYYLSSAGYVYAIEQYETLEIAMDQAQADAGVMHAEWTHCWASVPEDGVIPRSAVP